MKKILVTHASGLIGYSILRSLRASKNKYHLFGSTIYDDSIASAFCDTYIKCPLTSDKSYLTWLLKEIKEHSLDLIIPGATVDVTFWNNHRKILEESGVKVLLNDPALISLCDDKWEFHKVMEKFSSQHSIPTTLDSDFGSLKKKFGLPLLLKPKQSEASKGVVKIEDELSFNRHKDKIGSELIVQPYIGSNDEEYTAIAFCDGNGDFYNIIIFNRKLSKQGYTNEVEVCQDKRIKKAVLNICKIFKPVGPTNFQFRIQNDLALLLEINARFSSSTSMAAGFGFNIPQMAAAFYLEGKIPEQPVIKNGRAVRYIEDHFFYR